MADAMAPLSNEEIEQCRVAFNKFDKDGSGSIADWELKQMLQSMGQDPSDDEIFEMIAQVDDDGSNEIDFGEFCKVIQIQKAASAGQSDETDTIDAFIALGGNADKSGQVSADKLRGIIKEVRSSRRHSRSSTRTQGDNVHIPTLNKTDAALSLSRLSLFSSQFGLTIDIERLIREVDTDHSGFIDYQEFAVMMKS
jgi:Ca2+-binding EF-hand superfamily protein